MLLSALRRSLATRFAVAVLLVAFFSLLLLTGAAIIKFDQGMAIQADELARLSSRKLAERLDADARLAKARIELLFASRVEALGDITRLADVQRAVVSGNGVAMAELLTPLRQSADFDRIIVVDAYGRVVGADTSDTDLRLANLELARHPLFAELPGFLARNERQSVSVLKNIILQQATAQGGPTSIFGYDTIALVAAYPVFDEFGDVVGALVGHRALRSSEVRLQQFSKLTGIGVAIFQGRRIVSSAGLAPGSGLELSGYDEQLQVSSDGTSVARCITYELGTNLCTVLPMTELSSLRQDMMRSGVQQQRSLINWFIGLSIFIFCLFGITAGLVTRALVGPLSAITAAVLALSRGDWQALVPGLGRKDEVGDIARSVVVLQKSVEERDRLREESVAQNQRLVWQEQKLLQKNLQFGAALENMAHGLCMLDSRQRVAVLNDQFCQMFGISKQTELVGITAFQLKQRIANAEARQNFAKLAKRHLISLTEQRSAAFCVELADGRSIAITHRTMADGGSVATFADITDRRRDEARLSYLAKHDALTDLSNRVTLTERLTRALETSGRGQRVAVLFVDLDRFKALNDTFGHGAGDRVLRLVSARMRNSLKKTDTIARFGGDEFVVVQCGVQSLGDVEAVARRLIAEVSEPYAIDGRMIDIGATIGIAVSAGCEDDPENLLKQADLALYRAKYLSKGSFLFYDDAMDTQELARRALEQDLKAAMDGDEFSLAYQPIVTARTGRLSGFEALLRWQHPVHGDIPPAEFIPVAEKIGLINRLGSWVLRKACADAAAWPTPLTIAVNVSPLQVKAGGLGLAVAGALGASGLAASRLHLEITESVFLERNAETLAELHELQSMGVAFSMDDFGTGYSSLSSLRSFPFATLKIDRSFVAELAQDSGNRHIIEATCMLARKLNISCLAEGVETREQMDFLIESGCDELQGFYFGRPVPLEAALRLIHAAALAPLNGAAQSAVAA